MDKYLDFINVFLKEKVLVLLEQMELNKHVIDLENSKQLPYRPVFSLSQMELETLKTYIETHLKTRFIQPSKSSVGAPIPYNKKPNSNFRLYVDY